MESATAHIHHFLANIVRGVRVYRKNIIGVHIRSVFAPYGDTLFCKIIFNLIPLFATCIAYFIRRELPHEPRMESFWRLRWIKKRVDRYVEAWMFRQFVTVRLFKVFKHVFGCLVTDIEVERRIDIGIKFCRSVFRWVLQREVDTEKRVAPPVDEILYLAPKIRIESFFWKYAYSVADARGLNQFIPPTAHDVAARLGLEGFTLYDLYRPAVSIPMGAYYLNQIAEQTGGGPAAMLAGYYAGPGNAEIWLDIAQGDPDLLVEVIRLPDARGYVQTTFEFFEEYRALYGK